MKRPSLTPRDRRALRRAAILLLPALAYAGVVRPYLAARAEVVASVEQERDLLQRERSLVLGSAALDDRRAAAAAKLRQLTPLLFTGRDPTAQSGALASHVRAIASRNGVRVTDLRVPVADSAAEGLQLLFVEFRGIGDLEGIATMLRELETGTKLVAVRRLILARVTGPSAAEDEVEAIDIALLFQGLALPASTDPPSQLATASETRGTP